MIIRVAIICLLHLVSWIKIAAEEPISEPDIPTRSTTPETNQAIQLAKQRYAALLQNKEYQRVLSSVMNDVQVNAFLNEYQSSANLTQDDIESAYNSFDTTFKATVSLEQFNEFLQGEQSRRQALQALRDAQQSKTTDETAAQTKTPITLPDQPSNQIDETGLATKAKEKSFWTELYESIAAFFKAGSLGKAYAQLETQQTEIMRLAQNLTEAQIKAEANKKTIADITKKIASAQRELQSLQDPQRKPQLQKSAVESAAQYYELGHDTNTAQLTNQVLLTNQLAEGVDVQEVQQNLSNLKQALDGAKEQVLKLQELYKNADNNEQEIQECIRLITEYNETIKRLSDPSLYSKQFKKSSQMYNRMQSIHKAYDINFGHVGRLDSLIDAFNVNKDKEDIEYYTKRIADLTQQGLNLQAAGQVVSKSITDNQQRLMYEFNEIFKDLSANQRAELATKIRNISMFTKHNQTFLNNILNTLSPTKP